MFIRRLEFPLAEGLLSGLLGPRPHPSSYLPAENPIPRFRVMDPKPELASDRVSAVPAAGAQAAPLAALAVRVLGAQVLHGANAAQTVLRASAHLN